MPHILGHLPSIRTLFRGAIVPLQSCGYLLCMPFFILFLPWHSQTERPTKVYHCKDPIYKQILVGVFEVTNFDRTHRFGTPVVMLKDTDTQVRAKRGLLPMVKGGVEGFQPWPWPHNLVSDNLFRAIHHNGTITTLRICYLGA